MTSPKEQDEDEERQEAEEGEVPYDEEEEEGEEQTEPGEEEWKGNAASDAEGNIDTLTAWLNFAMIV